MDIFMTTEFYVRSVLKWWDAALVVITAMEIVACDYFVLYLDVVLFSVRQYARVPSKFLTPADKGSCAGGKARFTPLLRAGSGQRRPASGNVGWNR